MTGGGKHPHKAYCEKHSMEQKAKVLSLISFAILIMAYLDYKLAYICLTISAGRISETWCRGAEKSQTL
jgi:hypothetical protein